VLSSFSIFILHWLWCSVWGRIYLVASWQPRELVAKMSLVEFAKRELEKAKLFDKDGDFYGGMTGNAVMELIEVFAKQGHSGMSASIVRSLFNQLADYKPITNISNNTWDWNLVSDGLYQHNQVSSVFKNSKGKAYYLNGQIFYELRSEFTYASKDSKRPLKLPCMLPESKTYWWPWKYWFRLRNFFAGI
jgi:hypothetical protein